MRPSEVLRRATTYLERHGVESARSSAEALLAHAIGTDRAGLYTRTEGLSQREAREFGRALCRRCTGTPLQHLTGRAGFRRIELVVRPGVFVPRPETETLVEVALERVADVGAPTIADAGTGSGAVALAIKDERPESRVYATDLGPQAVALARENAQRLGLDVTVLEGDLLDPLPEAVRGRLDAVVSNPPYVAEEEFADLPAEVLADPELALLGGTMVHARLVREAPMWLHRGGTLALEIGASQADEVRSMLEDAFEDVRVVPDAAGRDRVVAGRLHG